jgi:4-amino-4-deoxy-L-arabinose transferase-like glycosyltransferase
LKRKYIVFVLFVIVAYLGLHRLDNTYFWDDEAHVGIVARNFLSTGRLTGWDGRNLYAFLDGGALDQNLRTRNAPMDIWVCALAYKLWGISTWSGRILFVIIGFITLGIFILIIKNDFGDDAWLWFYTLCVFGLSPVFLLYIRQCRYYVLSMLFSLLGYYAYRRCLSTKQIYYYIILSVSCILSFYSNPMACAAFTIALGLVHLLFHRSDFSSRDWRIMCYAILLFLLATVPYAIYYQVWDRPDNYLEIPEFWLTRHLVLIWWNLRDSNLNTYMPWPIFIGLIYLVFRYRKNEPVLKTALEWGMLAVLNIVFIAMISPQPTKKFSNLAQIRYIIASIPFLLGLVGIFLWYVNRRSRILGITLLAVCLLCNVLTLTPFTPQFRWLLPAYVYEIHHDYPTCCSAAVHYLETHAHQDDLVMFIEDARSYPVMFYLGDKLRFGCSLDYQAHIPMEVIRKLNAPLYIEENFPDWIYFIWRTNCIH